MLSLNSRGGRGGVAILLDGTIGHTLDLMADLRWKMKENLSEAIYLGIMGLRVYSHVYNVYNT